MTPIHRNFTIWRGNSEILSFRLRNEAGVPVDLTGSVVTLCIDSGGERINYPAEMAFPTSGEFIFRLNAAATRALTAATYIPNYEIERRIGDEQKTILFGNIILSGGVNND